MKKDYSKIKKVYVAGKLNDIDAVGYLHNVAKMMKRAEEVRKAGYAPFIPAIDLLMGIKFEYLDYCDYFDNSQAWLLASDALILTPGYETSVGTQKEMRLAIENDIPVFDDIGEMDRYFRNGRLEGNIIRFELDGNEIVCVYKYLLQDTAYGR